MGKDKDKDVVLNMLSFSRVLEFSKKLIKRALLYPDL
jgi:hypothetical protein